MWKRISITLARLPKWQIVVLFMFAAIILLSVIGPELAPYSTTNASPSDRLLPPSAVHWFGTDDNGIDILSRLLAAPRTDVMIAVVATAISVLLGSPLGVLIALLESRRGAGVTILSEIMMRLLEVIQAFPVFVFAMVLVAVFGGTKANIIAAIAFVKRRYSYAWCVLTYSRWCSARSRRRRGRPAIPNCASVSGTSCQTPSPPSLCSFR